MQSQRPALIVPCGSGRQDPNSRCEPINSHCSPQPEAKPAIKASRRPSAFRRRQPLMKYGWLHGRSPEETLAEVAAEFGEDARLLVRLNPLGGDGQIEGVSNLNHREHQASGLGVSF